MLSCVFVTLWVAACADVDAKHLQHHYSTTMLARDVRLAQVPYCLEDQLSLEACLSCPMGVKMLATVDDENGDGRAAIGYDKLDDTVVVSFRGSPDPVQFAKQIYMSTDNFTCFDDSEPSCMHKVQYTYQSQYRSMIKNRLVETVQEVARGSKYMHVKVVGHSRGAALAILFAYDIVRARNHVGNLVLHSLTTFGSPRVVNRPVIKFFIEVGRHSLLTRVVRDVDIVPFFPSSKNTRPAFLAGDPDDVTVTMSKDKPFFHVGHSMHVSMENEPEWFHSHEKTTFTRHAVFNSLVLLPSHCPELDVMPDLDFDICWH